jgi:death-on-curing protein
VRWKHPWRNPNRPSVERISTLALVEKAAALGFSMIQNHPFVDGNKRTGHAAMELFLVLNGHEIQAPVDEQFDIVLGVAAGRVSRDAFTEWLQAHLIKR